MPRLLTVTLPLPPREISRNGSQRNRFVKRGPYIAYRDECFYDVKRAMGGTFGPPMQKARLWITVEYFQSKEVDGVRRYHPSDIDNAIAMLKGPIDSLVLAGAIKDDNATCLELGRCVILGVEHVRKGVKGRVTLQLQELDKLAEDVVQYHCQPTTPPKEPEREP